MKYLLVILLGILSCSGQGRRLMMGSPAGFSALPRTTNEFITNITSFGASEVPVGNKDYGMRFTVSQTIKVVSLGRWIVGGNVKAHALHLGFQSGCTDQTNITLQASLATTTNAWFYTNLTAEVTLTVGNEYYLTSCELDGADEDTYLQPSAVQASAGTPLAYQQAIVDGCAGSPVCLYFNIPANSIYLVNFKYYIP